MTREFEKYFLLPLRVDDTDDVNIFTANSKIGYIRVADIKGWDTLRESLLPCPCCGGRGEMDNIHVSGNLGHKWTFGIVCTKCALGHFLGYDTAEAARDAWNLRGGKKAS